MNDYMYDYIKGVTNSVWEFVSQVQRANHYTTAPPYMVLLREGYSSYLFEIKIRVLLKIYNNYHAITVVIGVLKQRFLKRSVV